MKFVYPGINHIFDTSDEKIHSIIIENQRMYRELLEDICEQLQGNDGSCVMSEGEKPLAVSKYCELLQQFVPFSLNKKSLITKINQMLVNRAISDEHYVETARLMGELESYLYELAFDIDVDIDYGTISPETIVKAAGVVIKEEYSSLAEKVLDYMELVRELERDKLFILVNIRNYIDDEEMQMFIKTIQQHQYHVIMVESTERFTLQGEKRYIVDEMFCEIE